MNKEILINAGIGETRVAIVEDGRLEQYFIERTLGADTASAPTPGKRSADQPRIGDIILGRVVRVLPGMQAAFVEIGAERAGFLAVREAHLRAARNTDDIAETNEPQTPPISQCVTEGQKILVQIIKDAAGEKGARLSANVTLCGRLMVLTPMQSGIWLSKRITDEDERARLAAIGAAVMGDVLPQAGCILRTVAIGTCEEELRDDAVQLAGLWRQIEDERKRAKIPATLHRDLDLVERVLRDEADAATTHTLIDDRQTMENARAYCLQAAPQLAEKIAYFSGPEQLFARGDVESAVAGLYHTRVPLPCGGWITLEATEGLTAIDVNSGSFTAAGALEDTALSVNLEAATEAGRQIRLRGIGGLIVIDFIHLNAPENIESVLDSLAQSLAKDRVPFQLSAWSEFGIVQITRKRSREPLAHLASKPCQSCHGGGRQPTPETVGLEILRRVVREAAAAPGKAIVVRAAPSVADWLNSQAEEVRERLTRRGVAQVQFDTCETYKIAEYDVSARF